MRTNLVVLALIASSLVACTVSPGVDAAVPEPSVSEIDSTESTLENDRRDDRKTADVARFVTADEREAAERLAHTAESAPIQK